MREDRLDIETALNHRAHLIPGLEHFSSVDSLDKETLENNVIPIDPGVIRQNTEKRELTAVLGRLDHIVEGG